MNSTIETPEHLRHYEYHRDGDQPFTALELAAIAAYENGSPPDVIYGADDLIGFLASAEFLGERSPEPDDSDPNDPTTAADIDRAHILAHFNWLSDWYQLLDSLKSGLRNGGYGPAHSPAGYRYLQDHCNYFFRTLNLVRREACRWAFGTAGPRPEVDAGHLTFFDIPGIKLDGTIAAESE